MKLFFVILTFICIILSSCTDDLNGKNEPDLDDIPTNSAVDPNLEALHALQTDKQMILSSMIMYDFNKEEFTFDLSWHDAESLGISKEAYDEAKSLVDKMNESDSSK